MPFVTRLIEHPAGADEAFVLVAHGGILRHGLPMVIANLSHEFAARGLGHMGCVEVELQDGALRCLRWEGVDPA